MDEKYFVELISGGSRNFNVWELDGGMYYNVATLFYEDSLCGTQWGVVDREKSVKYTTGQIADELESPLREVSAERVRLLLKLTSPQEVALSLDALLK